MDTANARNLLNLSWKKIGLALLLCVSISPLFGQIGGKGNYNFYDFQQKSGIQVNYQGIGSGGGIKAITVPDNRWHRCDIKATTLLANVLARAQATAEGADEAVLVRDGQVIEGTASNLFIVDNGLLITPPDGDELLPGETVAAQIRLDQPIALVRDDRFVLRSYSPVRTIGGGKVLFDILSSQGCLALFEPFFEQILIEGGHAILAFLSWRLVGMLHGVAQA